MLLCGNIWCGCGCVWVWVCGMKLSLLLVKCLGGMHSCTTLLEFLYYMLLELVSTLFEL